MTKYQHPLFSRWRLIRYHTTCETSSRYWCYGGRGITMKKSWLEDFWEFAEWVETNLGLPTSQWDYLERKNNDRGYTPGNLEWSTAKKNSQNTRQSRWIRIKGREQCLSAWLEELGVPSTTYMNRRHNLGWTELQSLGVKPHPDARK